MMVSLCQVEYGVVVGTTVKGPATTVFLVWCGMPSLKSLSSWVKAECLMSLSNMSVLFFVLSS
jgi:hypothetical protein